MGPSEKEYTNFGIFFHILTFSAHVVRFWSCNLTPLGLVFSSSRDPFLSLPPPSFSAYYHLFPLCRIQAGDPINRIFLSLHFVVFFFLTPCFCGSRVFSSPSSLCEISFLSAGSNEIPASGDLLADLHDSHAVSAPFAKLIFLRHHLSPGRAFCSQHVDRDLVFLEFFFSQIFFRFLSVPPFNNREPTKRRIFLRRTLIPRDISLS